MSKRAAKNGGASKREPLLPMEDLGDEQAPLFDGIASGGGGGSSRNAPAEPHCCAVCCTFFSAVAIVLLLFFSCMVQSPFVHPEGKLEWTNTVRNPTLHAAVATIRFPACCADPVACAPSLSPVARTRR